jgi:O-antigen/teichoic acid export membrane protein
MTPEPRTNQPPSLGAQVSRAVIWNVLFVPLRLLSEIIVTLIKFSVLAPASYGLLSIISATNSGLGTTIDLGTGRALPKFIPESNKIGGQRAVVRLLLVALGAQSVLLLISGALMLAMRARYLGYLSQRVTESPVPRVDQQHLILFIEQSGGLLIGAILLVLLFGIFYDVLMAYLSSFFKQRAWNSITLVVQTMSPLLTAGAILAGWDVAGVVIVMVFVPAVATALVGWQVLRHQRELTVQPQPDDAGRWLPPGFVRYCGVSLLMTGTDFLASAGFALFFARDVIDIAILSAGVNIVKVMLAYLYTPMVGVQVPLFTRVRAAEGGTLQGAYQSLIRLQVLLLVPGGIGLLLLARPIFALLQATYVNAAPLVWILVPCLFLESLLMTAHNALIVYEKLKIIIISRLLTLVCVPLVVVLLPRFGIAGAALAFGLARVLAGAWVTTNGYRLLGLRWPWQFTLRVGLASAIMALLVGLLSSLITLPGNNATRLARLALLPPLVAIAGAGAISFLIALRLLGGIDAQDRRQLTQLRLPLKRWIFRVL